MAVPAYTHDLIDWIADSDTTAWGELTNAIAGGAPDEADTESALQGTNTTSQITNATTLCSMCRILATPVTLTSGQVFLVWHGHGVATALVNYANGGLRLAVASTLDNWKAWAVGGVDVPPYPYGRWINNPIDPTITAEYTNGTPPTGATNIYGVGSMCLLSLPVARGQPHAVDIIRYGRAQSRFTGGETSNYCVFSGYATLNDAQTARWGLISTTAGGYLWKGLMLIGLSTVATTQRARTTNVATLTVASGHGLQVGDTVVITGLGGTGYNATAVITARTATSISYANNGTNEGTTADTGGLINGIADFRDSNVNVFIQDTRKVYSAFNRIEIRNASTNVNWSGVNFANLSPSTTASKGELEVIDNATVVMDSCNFTDMNTFIFLGNSNVTNSRFLRCGQVTSGGGLFTNTSILSSTVAADASALVYNVNADPDGELDGMTFSKGTNDHHAITLGVSCPSTITLRGITFNLFNASDAQNNSVLLLADKGLDTAWTINAVGCNGTVSYKKVRAGDTVSIVVDPVTISVNVKNTLGANIQNARVILKASDGTGPFPFEESVTIVNSGATATVTHTDGTHGMATNDKVVISGASLEANNGIFTITVTGTATYTYTMGSSPGSSPTGTIISTFVALSGLTDVNGNLSTTRVFPTNQPVVGWVRKHSTPPNYTPPNYKTGPIGGSINSTTGFTANVQLVSDD